jgi:hypothetical protein
MAPKWDVKRRLAEKDTNTYRGYAMTDGNTDLSVSDTSYSWTYKNDYNDYANASGAERMIRGMARSDWQSKLRWIQRRPSWYVYDLWYETNIDVDKTYTTTELKKKWLKVRGVYVQFSHIEIEALMKKYENNKYDEKTDNWQLPYVIGESPKRKQQVRLARGDYFLMLLQKKLSTFTRKAESKFRHPPHSKLRYATYSSIMDIIFALKEVPTVPYPQEEDILLSYLSTYRLNLIYEEHEPHKFIDFTCKYDEKWSQEQMKREIKAPMEAKKNTPPEYKVYNKGYDNRSFRWQMEAEKRRMEAREKRLERGGLCDPDEVGLYVNNGKDTMSNTRSARRLNKKYQELIEGNEGEAGRRDSIKGRGVYSGET